jgi:predicted PurR-regulated permease PerM
MNKQQGFLLSVLLVAMLVSFLIVLPFLEYILGGIIIAYVLFPVNERLVPYLGRRFAPAVTITIAGIGVFAPLWYIVRVLFRDLVALSRGETALQIDDIETAIRDVTGQEVDLAASTSSLGADLIEVFFGDVTTAVSAGLSVSIGAVLTLFLIYYLLRDGTAFVEWLMDVAPMSSAVCSRLFRRIDRTTWGVIVGHLFVAFLQGTVGGVGLLIAGIPNVVFWTFTMILLALLPLIGAFLVWAPAAAYLFAIGEVNWGLFLLIYGVAVVSMIDNYARPLVIDRSAHLNPAVVLIGVFGGTYAIGMTGIFVGPIALAVLVATVTAFDEEYDAIGGLTDE